MTAKEFATYIDELENKDTFPVVMFDKVIENHEGYFDHKMKAVCTKLLEIDAPVYIFVMYTQPFNAYNDIMEHPTYYVDGSDTHNHTAIEAGMHPSQHSHKETVYISGDDHVPFTIIGTATLTDDGSYMPQI